MASLLRQIVAGPRARHPEAGLDLCYVTDNIIATSGPSGTYPQRYYRNPLDSLVEFLDKKHKDNWAIWEFRAEGTGYPDSEVYDRIYHYPFPDHHPPPFQLIPNIVASMRNWRKGGDGRVVVVHCKAGKGRSGTASVSYLISEEGWTPKDALKRFTERRMKPGWGDGVSIPSQLRWIGYVEKWAKHGKIYVERQVEILEVHCWGLRDGVKIEVEGFVDEGKLIKSFHTFSRSEREIVRGEIQVSGGLTELVGEVMAKNGIGRSKSKGKKDKPTTLSSSDPGTPSSTTNAADPTDDSSNATPTSTKDQVSDEEGELGTGDVVYRPSKRVILPTSDINIDVERRNKAAFDLTMVTSVAHVWFNAFFEGNGPENSSKDLPADDSGVFEITWEKMDGIKGSSRKGTQAFDKVAVVWKALPLSDGKPGIVITEPGEGEEVKQSSPADWHGTEGVAPSEKKDLGLRTASPVESSSDLSKAGSVKSVKGVLQTQPDPHEDSGEGVRSHGPNGEETVHADIPGASGSGPTQSSSTTPTPFIPVQVDGSEKSQSVPHLIEPHPPSHQPARLANISREASKEIPHEGDGHNGTAMPQVGEMHHPVSTGDLPDGKAESELKNAKEHALGHLRRKNHGKEKDLAS
ncbi:hypothetical protein BDV96DRAFT_230155 [Lophiotrema nucula]|uniref:phosphatidylinositol-3,4,5-trisphosphate 3-phosphatase n=1 Tax=Lophiotrema nucula TaxID=690887 RepID=A0A6A5YS02_9PLEO|nr:hypothetical protein BDV96DRAFT_230155 [Lophiotrema nucula]